MVARVRMRGRMVVVLVGYGSVVVDIAIAVPMGYNVAKHNI